MDEQKIIQEVSEIIKSHSSTNISPSHDWWHIKRVWNNAKNIGGQEKADMFIVELAALLHDVGDWKFNKEDSNAGSKQVRQILKQFDISNEIIEKICFIIDNVSFKGGIENKMHGLEGFVVQDADRLDAIGAIGIARVFSGAGEFKETFYDPAIPVPKYNSTQEYVKSRETKRTTVNHFYEKLLLLKDRMNTNTGKKIAKERHKFMEDYLQQFFNEWDAKI